MKLFWMEVKRQTTSLTFTIYTLLVMAFVLLNMGPMLGRNVAALPTSTNSSDAQNKRRWPVTIRLSAQCLRHVSLGVCKNSDTTKGRSGPRS